MSPLNAQPYQRIELAGPEQRTKNFQAHWYDFLAEYVYGMSVLDVGAGSGYGASLLQAGSPTLVKCIDPEPLNALVSRETISNIESKSFDVVAAVDVLEHVENDYAFLSDLLRVAKHLVFLSTPNWNVTKCTNVYHVREYTPLELSKFLFKFNVAYDAWTGDAECKISPIESLNDASNNFGLILHGHT